MHAQDVENLILIGQVYKNNEYTKCKTVCGFGVLHMNDLYNYNVKHMPCKIYSNYINHVQVQTE